MIKLGISLNDIKMNKNQKLIVSCQSIYASVFTCFKEPLVKWIICCGLLTCYKMFADVNFVVFVPVYEHFRVYID